MKTKNAVPISGRRAIPDTGEQTSYLSKAWITSRLKVVLAWSVVLLPLAWGLYTTGQIAAPLVQALLSHSC